MTQSVDYVGPFDTTHVVFCGRRVPYLTATLVKGGVVALTLDDRFGLDLSVAEAEKVVPFIAEAIAVASGYSCHPGSDEEPNPRPLFPRVNELEFLPPESQGADE